MSPEARIPEAAQQEATTLLWEEWKVALVPPFLPSFLNGDGMHKASCSATEHPLPTPHPQPPLAHSSHSRLRTLEYDPHLTAGLRLRVGSRARRLT